MADKKENTGKNNRTGSRPAAEKKVKKAAVKEPKKVAKKAAAKESKKPIDKEGKKVNSKQSWKPGNMLYPLPAIMVSCARPNEKPNIITLAWTGTICSDPAMVSISVRKERYSYDIIKETGEFVINLTTEALAEATDFCGVRSGRDLDKFAEMRLTAAPSTKLACPIIAESPVNIECKVKEILPLGSHDMFIAEVVAVNVSEEFLNEKGKFEFNEAKPIVYSHGEYFALGKSLGRFGYSVRKN